MSKLCSKCETKIKELYEGIDLAPDPIAFIESQKFDANQQNKARPIVFGEHEPACTFVQDGRRTKTKTVLIIPEAPTLKCNDCMQTAKYIVTKIETIAKMFVTLTKTEQSRQIEDYTNFLGFLTGVANNYPEIDDSELLRLVFGTHTTDCKMKSKFFVSSPPSTKNLNSLCTDCAPALLKLIPKLTSIEQRAEDIAESIDNASITKKNPVITTILRNHCFNSHQFSCKIKAMATIGVAKTSDFDSTELQINDIEKSIASNRCDVCNYAIVEIKRQLKEKKFIIYGFTDQEKRQLDNDLTNLFEYLNSIAVFKPMQSDIVKKVIEGKHKNCNIVNTEYNTGLKSSIPIVLKNRQEIAALRKKFKSHAPEPCRYCQQLATQLGLSQTTTGVEICTKIMESTLAVKFNPIIHKDVQHFDTCKNGLEGMLELYNQDYKNYDSRKTLWLTTDPDCLTCREYRSNRIKTLEGTIKANSEYYKTIREEIKDFLPIKQETLIKYIDIPKNDFHDPICNLSPIRKLKQYFEDHNLTTISSLIDIIADLHTKERTDTAKNYDMSWAPMVIDAMDKSVPHKKFTHKTFTEILYTFPTTLKAENFRYDFKNPKTAPINMLADNLTLKLATYEGLNSKGVCIRCVSTAYRLAAIYFLRTRHNNKIVSNFYLAWAHCIEKKEPLPHKIRENYIAQRAKATSDQGICLNIPALNHKSESGFCILQTDETKKSTMHQDTLALLTIPDKQGPKTERKSTGNEHVDFVAANLPKHNTSDTEDDDTEDDEAWDDVNVDDGSKEFDETEILKFDGQKVTLGDIQLQIEAWVAEDEESGDAKGKGSDDAEDEEPDDAVIGASGDAKRKGSADTTEAPNQKKGEKPPIKPKSWINHSHTVLKPFNISVYM